MDPFGTKSAEISREANFPRRERRCSVRHRVHTPAYASLTGTSRGFVLELNEILDINEEGLSIQTSAALDNNQSLNLCLDLSETKTYIHTSGRVIWSDSLGRSGVRFPQMPDESLRRLREWLFLNAITACDHANALSRYQAGGRQPSHFEPPNELQRREQRSRNRAVPEYAAVLTALAAIERKIEAGGADLEASLQLIVERGLTFTGATGAAIALAQVSEMICVASAGPHAPGIGIQLNVGSGFSGECVRSGTLLRCDDSETDRRVDLESCRAMEIRSMLAAPIYFGDEVVGLIELFSMAPNAFGADESDILRRLAQISMVAVGDAKRASSAPSTLAQDPLPGVPETAAPETPLFAIADTAASRHRNVLLYAVVITLVFAAIWLLAPWFENSPRRWIRDQAKPSTPLKPHTSAVTPPAPNETDARGFAGLRQLAEQGDATAQFAMGVRYATGDEVEQSYPEAVRWFSMAAEQGHIKAQGTLGAYYQFGRGVSEDMSKAYFWAVLASAGGDEISKERVASLASRMNRGDVIAARQQANEWLARHQLESKNTPAPQ